ncbi:energy-coupling factor ABC transporter ATP-binding protein [Granulicatella sp. s8]|uniref:Energy-coupling factor ABC transporter ATP-binding protein n=1 Tax=Granulicatella seriolae TaxID=2967226 RepID=A0ABT1WM89_9LACT|nr:energy-coupling factor ABC transporter ATP-binding protein [Granulicatella seriolae]
MSFSYPQSESEALSDISLEIFPGEWIAVIGHNGSGKSTLAKIINGLIEANQGQVWVEQELLTEETIWSIRRKVGMVFQNPDNQFVGSTVEDDIAFGLENAGVPRDEMIKAIDRALAQVGMSDFRTKEPARLSGGQKQRVAIAGIVALQPKVVILDEATSMLDPEGREDVLGTIKELNQEKQLTVISITHDLEEASQADRVIMMKQGRIHKIGRPNEIFQLGSELVEAGLDVPFQEKLKEELVKRGIDVPQQYQGQEGLVEWLWTSVLSK